MRRAPRSTASPSLRPSRNGYGNGATKTPLGSGWYPLRYPVLEVVIAIVRCERPWNEPWKTITFGRPVACLASLTAASVASAPELAKKNESIPAGVMLASRSASCSSRGCR